VYKSRPNPPIPFNAHPALRIMLHCPSAALLVKELRIQGLKDLVIRFPTSYVSIATWRGFFRRHGTIQNLYIHGTEHHDIVKAIGSVDFRATPKKKGKPKKNGGGGPSAELMVRYANTLPLPHLAEITLDAIRFDGEDWTECPEFLALEDFFIDRWNYSTLPQRYDLPQMQLTMCAGFTEEMQDELEGVAGADRLYWDGMDCLYDEDDDGDDYGNYDEDDYNDELFDEFDDDYGYDFYHALGAYMGLPHF
jgi:hypothetical protein